MASNGRETIEIQDLPAAIQRLTPGDAEDFLCIYKKRFRPVRKTRRRPAMTSFFSQKGSSRERESSMNRSIPTAYWVKSNPF